MRDDVKVEFFKAGGPGGQHRNKTESGVRLTHVPTGIVVTATERRSQSQNLAVARHRLAQRLVALRRKPKPRKKTRPTRASVKRRLEVRPAVVERRIRRIF